MCLLSWPWPSLRLWSEGDIFFIPDILLIWTSIFKLLDFLLTASLKQSYICLRKHTPHSQKNTVLLEHIQLQMKAVNYWGVRNALACCTGHLLLNYSDLNCDIRTYPLTRNKKDISMFSMRSLLSPLTPGLHTNLRSTFRVLTLSFVFSEKLISDILSKGILQG